MPTLVVTTVSRIIVDGRQAFACVATFAKKKTKTSRKAVFSVSAQWTFSLSLHVMVRKARNAVIFKLDLDTKIQQTLTDRIWRY